MEVLRLLDDLRVPSDNSQAEASGPSRALNRYDPADNVDVDNAQRNTAAAGGGRRIRS